MDTRYRAIDYGSASRSLLAEYVGYYKNLATLLVS